MRFLEHPSELSNKKFENLFHPDQDLVVPQSCDLIDQMMMMISASSLVLLMISCKVFSLVRTVQMFNFKSTDFFKETTSTISNYKCHESVGRELKLAKTGEKRFLSEAPWA